MCFFNLVNIYNLYHIMFDYYSDSDSFRMTNAVALHSAYSKKTMRLVCHPVGIST